MKTTKWLFYYNTNYRCIKSKKDISYEYNFNSKIYFPVHIEAKPKNYGSIVEIKKSYIEKRIEINKENIINFKNLSFTQKNMNNDSILSDLDRSIYTIKEVIKELIKKESIINNHYIESLEFLNFTYTPTLNLITDENANISDTSYSLALAVDIINSATNFNNDDKVCFTGSFTFEDGTFKISEVNGVEEKLIAVLNTDITKFVIPLKNKEAVLKFLDLRNDNYIIDKKNSKLQLIFSDTFEEVLKKIYGENFFNSFEFRNVFDIGYLYKQKTLNSSIVKIKSVFNFFEVSLNDKEHIPQNYVKIKSLKKENSYFQDKIDIDHILYNIKDESKNIILIGDKGSGKTSLLKRLVYLICDEKITNFNKLPIFVELNSIDMKKYTNKKIDQEIKLEFRKDLIKTHLKEIELDENIYSKFLEYLDENNKLIFIIDGYDEKKIKHEFFSDKLFIISCKYYDNLSGDFYKILPMDDISKVKFISDHSNKTNILDKACKVEKIFSNPLFLSLFLLIEETYLLEINNQGILMNIVTNKFLNRTNENKSSLENLTKFEKLETKVDITSKLLKEMAFEIFKKEQDFLEEKDFENIIFSKIILNINKIQGYDIVNYTNYLDILLYISNSFGIIEEIKSTDIKRFVFSHEIFYEFFLAKYFIEEMTENEKKEWIILNFKNLKKINIFRIVATLVKMNT